MRLFALAALAAMWGLQVSAAVPAENVLHVYGPGGPLPAMRDAATAFGRMHGVTVKVTAGPTPQWIDQARLNGDVIYSGSEVMMSDFIAAMPEIDAGSVRPLYLRSAAILVRPGNPAAITGINDLLKSSHHILVVNGAGQQGLWEDVAGRLGQIQSVRAFRSNITVVAKNSAEARKAWISDKSLDAWLIWTIWQDANPTLADQVAIEPRYAIYRDTGVALTKRGEKRLMAKQFADFLASPRGAAIFAKWGWMAPSS